MRDVWHASGAIGYPWDSYFRVLLLTAQRRGEVAGMRWVDVDLEKAIWTLPKEQTKANRTHDVPLTKKVLAILKALPRFNKGPYVFTTTNGVKAINGFAKMKKKLDAEVFKLTGIKPEPGEGYTVHDFRSCSNQHRQDGRPAARTVRAAEPHSRSRAGRDRNIQSLQVHGGTSGRTRTVGRPGDQAGRREKTENSVESPTMSSNL